MCRLRSDLPTGIELRVDLDDETPSVLGDSDQLKQIILNLLTNSLDAVRGTPNPYVHCHAERAADDNPLGMPAVVLHVIDHGCGIPHDLQARVFTPFFSTKAQGTGLGLSLVNRIVREHEGLLALSSELGVGTTITIHLPAHSQTRSFRRALGTGD
jgi:signal transduction histidine kinase